MKGENDLDVWIDHAEDDFNAVGKLLRGKKPSIYGACFHAQQCGEKVHESDVDRKGTALPNDA